MTRIPSGPRKAGWAVAIMLVALGLAAANVCPFAAATMAGALAMVLTGCLTEWTRPISPSSGARSFPHRGHAAGEHCNEPDGRGGVSGSTAGERACAVGAAGAHGGTVRRDHVADAGNAGSGDGRGAGAGFAISAAQEFG